MDDYPVSGTATSGQLVNWGKVSGNIEMSGDTDWFRITLQSGVSYRFDLLGSISGNGTLSDPFLWLRDAMGNLIRFNDDSGGGLESSIAYYAQTSGTYFLEAAAFAANVGTYTLTVVTTYGPELTVLDGTAPIGDNSGFSFGQVNANAFAVKTLTVYNDGNQTLNVRGLTVPEGFILDDGLPAFLAPGAFDTITIRLDTTTFGERSGFVRVSTDDPNTAVFDLSVHGIVATTLGDPDIALKGNGREIFDGSPAGGFNYTDFGTTVHQAMPIGPLVQRTFSVYNYGAQTLTIGAVNLPPALTLVEPLDLSLAPGRSDTFTVGLLPFFFGPWGGQISIATNDPDENTFDFSVAGFVTTSFEPDITVQGNGRDLINFDTFVMPENDTSFGTVAVGAPTVQRTFLVRNDGQDQLRNIDAFVQGNFSIVGSLPNRLDPGSAAVLVIAMDTSFASPRFGTVTIFSNDQDEFPFQFNIAGEVIGVIADDYPILGPGTAGSVSPGGNVLGNLEVPVDTDWFNVTLQAGNSYRIDLEGQGGGGGSLGDGRLVLHDSTGNTILAQEIRGGLGGDAQIVYFAPSNGNYLIEVQGENGSSGNYRLSVSGHGGREATLLIDGRPQPGGLFLPSVDFGVVLQNQPEVQRQFALRNDGQQDLNASLSLPPGFVLVDPLAPLIPPGLTDTFTVRLNTSSPGSKLGTIDITTNDADEGLISFNVGGFVEPVSEVNVFGFGALQIPDGDATPSLTDHTDFGVSGQGLSGVERVFTVNNSGGAILETHTLVVPPGYTVVEPLSNVISPGASDTFTVRINTAMLGVYGGEISFATNDGDENPFNFAIVGTVNVPTEPEVNVTGNGGVSINDGDSTPSATDGTDFGSTFQGGSGVTKIFQVRNDGGVALATSALTVPNGYTVIEGLSATILPGQSDSISVRMDSGTLGTKSGQISFATNDTNENPFNFSVTGAVLAPPAGEIAVLGNGQNISDGDSTPQAADNTDFGTVSLGGANVDRMFTVHNVGTAALTPIGLTLPAGFSLIEGLSPSIAAGASDNFTVRLESTAVAIRSGEIVITSNDTDESPFNFSIAGVVVPSSTDDFPVTGAATNGVVSVGGSATGVIERVGDTDWFRVSLLGGTSYKIEVEGAGGGLGSLSNPYLLLRDGQGMVLLQDDDSGLGVDAEIMYTPAVSGIHLLEVRGSGGGDSGSYRLRAAQISGAEVTVLGNNQMVLDDATQASTPNGTDFGSIMLGAGAVDHSFTVRNDGTSPLALGGLEAPQGFQIAEGLSSILAAGAADTFTVRMLGSISGVHSGQVRFTTNDPSEGVFEFRVGGSVTTVGPPPEIVVTGNGVSIGDGDSTPSGADHTDFGTTVLGTAGGVQRVFTVRNDGGSTLNISSFSVPVGYSVIDPLDTNIPAAKSDTFAVQMDTAHGGIHAGQISFSHNDADESPFNFSIAGSVSAPRTTLTTGAHLKTGVSFTGFDAADAPTLPSGAGAGEVLVSTAADSFRVRVEGAYDYVFRGTFTAAATGLPTGRVNEIEVSATGGQTLFTLAGIQDPASGAPGLPMSAYLAFAANDNFVGLLEHVLYGPNTLTGHTSGKDNLRGARGDDLVQGLGGDDTLLGERGNDILIGGSGADTLRGGPGNDTYVRDDLDTIIELAGEGSDTVESAVSATLPDNVENLILTGDNNANGTGNVLDNLLVGNAAMNTLRGLAGNDRYVIQSAFDVVVETPDAGIDTVITSLALEATGTAIPGLTLMTLADLNIENVTLTGSAAISIIGTVGTNILIGNAGVNTLTGAGGDDLYEIQTPGDSVVELPGGGNDTVRSTMSFNLIGTNVENLTLLGQANLTATGDGGDNVLVGNRGNNTLVGGLGNDTIIGGLGFDTAGYSGPSTSYTMTRTGAEVTLTGLEGTDRLIAMERVAFADTTVVLPVVGRAAGTDLNGDEKGDLLWRHENGTVVAWLVDGITVPGGADLGLQAPIAWRVIAVTDLSGDGKADLVWRHDNGTVAVWLLDGTTVSGGAGLGPFMGAQWRAEGLSDFNADHKSDLLWRNDNGELVIWLLDGLTVSSQTQLSQPVASDWGLAGMADVSGDGKSDLLWRKDSGEVEVWAMDGARVAGKSPLAPVLGDDWTIAGVADFNADQKSDLLWRKANGQIDVWLLDGTNAPVTGTLPYLAPPGWNLEVINDLNADGKSDLLWRHDSGPIAIWLVDGADVPHGAGFPYQAPLGWNVTAVTDFNGDHRNDVLWRHDSGAVVAWFIDGTNFAGGGQLPYNAPTEWLAT